ncbi:uncharacterized protein LOC135117402 [Helicoverpa armigera]|uniref:uncharacterized protein LOC135117402 n=1 Tax=Helicoverpa armigera TaxID=29058 RepID=UPI003082DD0E
MTLFCFVLLYCRTRVMKITLDAIDFNDSNRDRFAVNRLIQMYEALVDTLKYIGYPFKVANESNINVNWMLISGQPTLFFMTLALVMDLTVDHMTDIQVICAQKIMMCNNERDRFGMERLLKLLEHRPLRYTILRLNLINLRCVLSGLSFFTINIIAVLQIKNFYA